MDLTRTTALLAGAMLATGLSHTRSATGLEALAGCVGFDESDLRRAAAGTAVVRTLPASGQQVAVAGLRRIAIDGTRLSVWARRIEQLKESPKVLHIRRLSSPPQLDDFRDLSLSDDERDQVRRCRPGACGLKLTGAEMDRLRRAAQPAVAGDELAQAFRQLALDRTTRYLTGGRAALGQYDDGHSAEDLAATFAALLNASSCLSSAWPALASALFSGPPTEGDTADRVQDRYLYWSQEDYAGRTVTSVTDVVVAAGAAPHEPQAVVAGRQVFATHYLNGSLNLTGVLEDGVGVRYLFIVNRSSVDVLRGAFGGIARLVIERRVRNELGTILGQLAGRLERGEPAR
jgi:hypothetical protein